ncbi:guanosine polyphosphate synthetase/pyrophosphohydrolase [Beggiatoa alba B18LD]|uniref:Guanosine polyphosphate synthetase/pyrophosphohydrolase n=1 Tax=Beggiatoa alba B18LD TaxID=395493 RepID=I3CKW8_9GAMM|nr:HD domain-containing protein [Beggiatoa alba]EIJ44261.1 guanosine polyphosphate synthetase/pyrophosphohydrolase [Beggiatoa alba B18LD]
MLETTIYFSAEEVAQLLKALRFSADKHRDQRRRDKQVSPYINHPIQVATLLWEVGKVYDIAVIIAALLHDTLEDTNTQADEIQNLFGLTVLNIVQEVTDDKSLEKAERKRLQVERAPHKSHSAKLVKLADKICNVRDILYTPPQTWSVTRCLEYVQWSEQVIQGIRGVNPILEAEFDQLVQQTRQVLTARQSSQVA